MLGVMLFIECNMMNFGNGTSALLHNFKGNVGGKLKEEKCIKGY